MSAFVVTNETINNILFGLVHAKNQPYKLFPRSEGELTITAGDSKEMAEIGKKLFALNCQAVDQRYGNGQSKEFYTEAYQYKPFANVPRMQVYKSMRCLLYQCSEGNVPDTKLFQDLNDFCNGVARSIISDLPEYDAASWD
jgi:hypothetical protein